MSKKQITLLLALVSATNLSHTYASGEDMITDKTETNSYKKKIRMSEKNHRYYFLVRAACYAGVMTVAFLIEYYGFEHLKTKVLSKIWENEYFNSLTPYVVTTGIIACVVPLIENMLCGCDEEK